VKRILLITAMVAAAVGWAAPASADDPYDVLVFSRTAGFRHDSIAAGTQAIRDLGSANGFSVTATENPATFTADGLAPYEAVVFLNTTGDVLDANQQGAFESYIRGGHGFVGVHAAADTEYDWPFYGELVGGRSFYTGGGHTVESYADPAFRAHLLGGIRYAAGQSNADCRPENGYATLYNGSTSGWSQAGPGGFTDTDATLTSTGGMGLFWYSAKQFTNYSLKLDWKLADDDNSGVFLGFPPSADPWSAVNNGYEVQIDATDTADRTTGSVYTFKSADLAARDAALNPPGEWNTYELLVEGEHLQVFLNGVKINDFTNTDPVRSLAGHIGIQNHGAGDEAAFRNVRIKELDGTGPVTPTGPVVGLAGKCLDVAGAGTADGTKIQLYTCNGTAAQRWTIEGSSFKALGKCLDVTGGGIANGTKVQLWTCNATGAQNWTPRADGTVQNPQSGRCLDVSANNPADGQQIHIWDCHTGPNQKWTLP
jgi:hypothetical protein